VGKKANSEQPSMFHSWKIPTKNSFETALKSKIKLEGVKTAFQAIRIQLTQTQMPLKNQKSLAASQMISLHVKMMLRTPKV
jgi:hypothetical protein